MTIKFPQPSIKKILSGHSWLGISVGALMYLVCLTGSLAVFFEEFERWEQPHIEEYQQYSAELINQSVGHALQRMQSLPESLYVVLPTDEVPRIHISDGVQEWFVNRDGSLSEPPVEGWTHMLKELHNNLHLPETVGLIIVASLGAMLCSLIISGLLAHPRLFKDAFKLRVGGKKHLEQVDIHNRLGVWGTPFFFIIGLTGAFFGLAGILISLSADISHNGDKEAVLNAVYGADPIVSDSSATINYARALAELKQQAATATPIYLHIHNINTDHQFLEIAATLPQRLIYSEMYRFKASGEFINHQGLSDGDVGRQLAYSVYRIHFGHFNGYISKILYAIMGLALTVLSASGINIWLNKRKQRSFLNDLWVAVVWGAPLALSLSAFFSLQGFSALLSFLIVMLVVSFGCLLIKDEAKSRGLLIKVLLLSILLLVVSHIVIFGVELAVSPAAFFINVALVSLSILAGLIVYYKT
ncbi:MAG: PepSY-associated TM helix domain-containing protein [Cycloclasticus sp.]